MMTPSFRSSAPDRLDVLVIHDSGPAALRKHASADDTFRASHTYVSRLTRLDVRRQRGAQLSPGCDPKLREHAVQVRADRAVREVKALADVAIREPLRRELRDLQLLRGQLIAGLGRPAP